MKNLATVCLIVALCFLALPSLAQTPAANPSAAAVTAPDAQAARIAKLEQAVASAQSSGDNAWMLVSAALVLMMTGPGLALFYGGLVRKKNVLATMMQSFALMAIVTLLWGSSHTVWLSVQATASLADFTTSFFVVWARLPIPTTRRPFLCKPSWCIS